MANSWYTVGTPVDHTVDLCSDVDALWYWWAIRSTVLVTVPGMLWST